MQDEILNIKLKGELYSNIENKILNDNYVQEKIELFVTYLKKIKNNSSVINVIYNNIQNIQNKNQIFKYNILHHIVMSNFKNEELKQLNLYFTNDEINILKDEIHILKESIHTLTESIDALKEIILTINVRTFDIIN